MCCEPFDERARVGRNLPIERDHFAADHGVDCGPASQGSAEERQPGGAICIERARFQRGAKFGVISLPVIDGGVAHRESKGEVLFAQSELAQSLS